MEFLVEIRVQWPADGDPDHRDELIRAEAARSRELVASGHIRRLWRRPGAWANVGVWSARDATELHEVVASLPFFPWLDTTVHPLAAHPNDPGEPKGGNR